jgi:DNA-binding LacI/PurR family transcriptional regulator
MGGDQAGSGGGRVSSNDVARLAGVSRSAVSRTFTPGTYVSEETRLKVLRAADLLGYRPNMMARSLITNRTHIVGVITTHLDNPFYATLLQRLIEEIQKIGMATLTFIADEHNNDERISRLLSYQVDALVLTNTSLSSTMSARCAQGETPVVAINRYLEIDTITSVTCDNESCGAAVADLLIRLKRKRIAFMSGEPDTSSSRDRETGFRRRLSERGAALHASAVGNYDHEDGVRAARELLSRPKSPDAIFCANDLMALATIDVARMEFGLDVPNDLAVVGFDNSDAASWPTYRLTSVDQNMARMVGLAVEEIVAAIAGTSVPGNHVLVPGVLIERESTGGTGTRIDVSDLRS